MVSKLCPAVAAQQLTVYEGKGKGEVVPVIN
jgi:hypothetical protein